MFNFNIFTFRAAYEACHLEPVYKAVWVSPMKSFSELMTGKLHEVILGAHDSWGQWSHSRSSQDRCLWQVTGPIKKIISFSEIGKVAGTNFFLKLMKGQPYESFLELIKLTSGLKLVNLGTHTRWSQLTYAGNQDLCLSFFFYSDLMSLRAQKSLIGAHAR